VDVELCQKFTGKFARKSAKRTSRNIGEIRDRYETIVLEFLAVRYTEPDGKRYSLSTVLRSKYETDEALQTFLLALSRWLGEYVAAADAEGFAPKRWTMHGHVVSENLLTELAEEYKRDRDGLMRFLSAVFKHWREIFEPYSLWRQLLLTQQMKTRNVKEFADYLEKIGAVPECTTPEQVEALHTRIKQYRSRDRKAALKRQKAQ
jgi:hypothetical protein